MAKKKKIKKFQSNRRRRY